MASVFSPWTQRIASLSGLWELTVEGSDLLNALSRAARENSMVHFPTGVPLTHDPICLYSSVYCSDNHSSFFSQYMRMMGLHPAIHFLSWFLENMATLALSSAALAVILKMSGIFMHSDAFIIFLFLLDFGVSAVMLSYFLSVFFNQANTAALCTSLGYMISFLPYVVLLVLHNQLSFTIQSLLVSETLCRNAK